MVERTITTNPYGPNSPEGEPLPAGETPTKQESQQAQPPAGPDTTPSPPPATSDPSSQEGITTPEPPTWNNPRLQGRTQREVDNLYGLAEETVQQQGRRLSEQESRIRELEGLVTSRPPAESSPGVSSQEFFADPAAHIDRMLTAAVAPLREEIQEAKRTLGAGDSRERLRREHPDFESVSPYLDMLLQRGNYPEPDDYGLLQTLYFTAKGYMADQGIDVRAQPIHESAANAPPQGTMIPQHRASTPPPPPRSADPTQPSRALTENEKRLAREYKMSDEDYLKWQEMDERDVPFSKIGLEQKGNQNA